MGIGPSLSPSLRDNRDNVSCSLLHMPDQLGGELLVLLDPTSSSRRITGIADGCATVPGLGV